MSFKTTTVPYGGSRVRGAVIECGHCGRVQSVPVNTFKGGASVDDSESRFIERKFERSGWKIGKNASQHRCAGCFAAIRNAAKHKQITANMENVVASENNVVKINTPRTMEREDRRIIFEKLNEVYLNEKAGYAADWTDAKVSTDLGVPRDWVKQVRDEMFGPEGSNGQIIAAIAEAKELLGEIRKIGLSSEKIVADLRALCNKADKIEKTVIAIEKAVH